mgnify:CR=1 FL=1
MWILNMIISTITRHFNALNPSSFIIESADLKPLTSAPCSANSKAAWDASTAVASKAPPTRAASAKPPTWENTSKTVLFFEILD